MIGKKTAQEILTELAGAATDSDRRWLAKRIREAEKQRDENQRTIETLKLIRDSLAATQGKKAKSSKRVQAAAKRVIRPKV